MKMETAFVNYDEGFACCCWEADSENDLKQLFLNAGAPIERIIPVEIMKTG